MRITAVSFQKLNLILSEPYTIAYEVVQKAVNYILIIETESNIIGFGCAAPDHHVTGESPEKVELSIKDIVIPYLKNKDPFNYALLMEELQQMLPSQASTLAMVDMALFDLMSKKAQVPLYQFLGGYRNKIETSITIGICTIEETIQYAEKHIKNGFRTLKIKGGLNLEEDIERMIKIREIYHDCILRFDGNQGYTVQQAIDFFNATKEVNIEIFEQPTQLNQDEFLGAVTKQIKIPVMADESIKSLADTFRLVRNERIDMINIKLMKVGGILEAMHINSVAKSDCVEVMVGCLDECALGISAGLHFALSRPNVQYADLDGHLDFINDPLKQLFQLEDGWLTPSSNYGLGLKKI